MASIARALVRIKQDVVACLSGALIEQVCRDAGHAWRERVLDPVTLLHLFLLQILHGNTACAAVPRLSGQSFTASAYCQARSRLPLRVIAGLVSRIGGTLRHATAATGLWHDHRVILVDGSGVSMPDTPALQAHFGQPGGQAKGCGFPVGHLLAVFEAGTGLILDLLVAPLRTHDMAQINQIHTRLQSGDLLLADRAFCSYSHLALMVQHDLHACLRMHQRQIVDFRRNRRHATGHHAGGRPTSRWMARLGHLDQVVAWIKPTQKPGWMSAKDFAALPSSIQVRELRYRIRTPGFRTRDVTLVTTLLDSTTYPADELAALYQSRWQVEINLRHLKTTLGLDVLHCKTVDGVMKELWMFVLVYNLVRLVMLEAARRQGVPPNRISFIDALRWLSHAPPEQSMPTLIVNPDRRNRIEPRVIKRRTKRFPLMQQPRDKLKQALLV